MATVAVVVVVAVVGVGVVAVAVAVVVVVGVGGVVVVNVGLNPSRGPPFWNFSNHQEREIEIRFRNCFLFGLLDTCGIVGMFGIL